MGEKRIHIFNRDSICISDETTCVDIKFLRRSEQKMCACSVAVIVVKNLDIVGAARTAHYISYAAL